MHIHSNDLFHILYGAASLWMLHSIAKGMLLFFSSKMWFGEGSAVVVGLFVEEVAVGIEPLL